MVTVWGMVAEGGPVAGECQASQAMKQSGRMRVIGHMGGGE
jgi:hypothetical protein